MEAARGVVPLLGVPEAAGQADLAAPDLSALGVLALTDSSLSTRWDI
jgi:hypothetical protein